MSPSREHSSIHGERTGFNFHFVWKLNYFILLLQAKPARKQTVKKYLNQGNINPLPPCHNSVQLLSLQELQTLSFASKHHFFIHFISQNFKILPFSTLANTLHWTPLLPSDSDFEHNFMNDKRWPLSYFLCRLLSAGLFSTVLVFFCTVLYLHSTYQTFISVASCAGYYWQRVHCSVYQTYTGKLLLAMILHIFFGSAIRLQHMWFVLVALHGLGTKNVERHPCF